MTTSHPPNRVKGSIRAENGTGTVRMEDIFDTAVADVWSAMTQPDRLSRWIADVTGDLRPGGLFHARFTSSWDGPGRIDICEPQRRIVVTMGVGSDEETVIEALLSGEGDHTRLVVEERGLPLEHVAGHGAGWQAHIEDLAVYLDGQATGPWRARWLELTPQYRELARELS